MYGWMDGRKDASAGLPLVVLAYRASVSVAVSNGWGAQTTPYPSCPILPVQPARPASPVPGPVLFSCRSAARVTTYPAPLGLRPPSIYCLQCDVYLSPSRVQPLGRIGAASTSHPCTDRPPQPRAAGSCTRHGRWTCAESHELLLETSCSISRTRPSIVVAMCTHA